MCVAVRARVFANTSETILVPFLPSGEERERVGRKPSQHQRCAAVTGACVRADLYPNRQTRTTPARVSFWPGACVRVSPRLAPYKFGEEGFLRFARAR